MDILIKEVRRISRPDAPAGYMDFYVAATATEGEWSYTEEFHIGRHAVGKRIVTNEDGWWKVDSPWWDVLHRNLYIDPTTLDGSEEYVWEYEDFLVDLRAEILSVVRKTMLGKLARHAPRDRRDSLKRQVILGDSTTLPLEVRQLENRTVAA